jgi:hypothetical protein
LRLYLRRRSVSCRRASVRTTFKDFGLDGVECVGVADRDGQDAQVGVHPFGEFVLVDISFAAGGCEDRAQAEPEGREFVSSAEMHVVSRPQRVLPDFLPLRVRVAPARPA